jgi:hypothetical protein
MAPSIRKAPYAVVIAASGTIGMGVAALIMGYPNLELALSLLMFFCSLQLVLRERARRLGLPPNASMDEVFAAKRAAKAQRR